jgi:hypothetical protein
MPVGIDDRLDCTHKGENILRVRSVATIDKEMSAFARQGDDVVSRPGNQRHLLGELL